jgi:poly-gamma-glutamate system protein
VVGLIMRAAGPIRYADHRPLSRTPWLALTAAAVLSLATWQATEAMLGRFTHPAYGAMIRAAHAMQAATQVARAQRTRLGLDQPVEFDPNRTGLIGSEYTDITTSLGDPAAKRTATNPDLAAALARRIAELDLAPGSPVFVLVSGSFIGGNIAAIVAVEALGHRPIIVASLGASMHGATDPSLTWLDIEAELHRRGIIGARSLATLIGGGSAQGGGLSDEGVTALREAAARNEVPIIDNADVATLVSRVINRVDGEIGGRPALLVNSGGSVTALGTCTDGHTIPPMVVGAEIPCKDGTPGVIVREAGRRTPVLHLLNMRGLAVGWGLPYDPVPLPLVGNNRAVYGMPPRGETAAAQEGGG